MENPIMKSLKPFTLAAVSALSLSSQLALAEDARVSPESPDVLFVLVDDLRWDAFSFLGHPYIETPNIDTLRSQGAWMENSFVTTSICCPSRATFLTGTYANRHGVIDNESSEYNPDVTPPVSKYLQEAGYKTAMVGKWHMGNSGAPRPYFDYWLSFKGQGVYNDPLFNINGEKIQQKGYTTDLLTDYAIDFINDQPKEQPFFLMLSHKAVHEPFQPAPRHKDAFGANTTTPEPESWSEDFADKPAWIRRQRARDVRWNYRTRDYAEENLPDMIPPPDWKPTKKYVDQLRCLSAVDEGLGRIMEVLRERGTLDNTLIVFTSDNGYFHLEHQRWDKRLAYEESLRIPMIVVYPGKIQAGSTVTQLITNADFAPTVLGYAGLEVPCQMQGADMQPLFEEENPQWRDAIFYEYWKELVHAIPTMTAVRTDRYKLITFPEIDDIDELYNLDTDPHEMSNLVHDPAYAGLHAEMLEKLYQNEVAYDWDLNVFPKNLPRIRGEQGVLLDLTVDDGQFVDKSLSGEEIRQRKLEIRENSLYFDGDRGAIQVAFNPTLDPAAWPFRIDVAVRPESDGVIAVQSTPGYGFKIFVQDGRPGVSVHCKTWIDTTTTIDGPDSILGNWAHLEVLIDYNRLVFIVDGIVAESVSLPLPFKGSPKTPLVIGSTGTHPVAEGIPDNPFRGEIRRFTLQRGELR
jgi:N-acetylglucosamine-6-sulfatase